MQCPGAAIRGDRWAGDPERPSVVLLHGGGQTRHSWDSTAERLNAQGWPVVTLDARGHGGSDWREDRDYRIDGFVRDLEAFVASLDAPPILVGASLGGITGLLLAGEQPGAVAGLVLVDVVVQFEPAGLHRIHGFLTAHADGFADLDEVADAIEAYTPDRQRGRNLDGVRKNVRLREDGRWYWHWDPAFLDPADGERRAATLARLRDAAAHLTIPLLIVRGLRSDVVSDAGVQDMLSLVPQAEVSEVGRAGHMVAGDDNDVFAADLGAFLSRVAAIDVGGGGTPAGSQPSR